MKYFSSSYLITTSLALLSATGSTLSKAVSTGTNTDIANTSNSTSKQIIPSGQPPIYQNDPASAKIIKEATEKPTYDNPIAKQLMLDRAKRSEIKEYSSLDGGDLSSLFKEPADNSDVALHRSKREAEDIVDFRTMDLPNGNCAMVGKGSVYYPPHWLKPERTNLYAKCAGEPCKYQKFISSEEGKKLTWGDSLQSLYLHDLSFVEPQTIQAVFTHKTYYHSGERGIHSEKYKCDVPLSERYQHFKECEKLESGKKYAEALIECDKSLEAYPNFKPALNLKTKLGKLMAAVTTIEPSSSASLIEEASNPTGNFTMAGNFTTTTNSTTITEETTTPVEPSNAAFKGIAAPTAIPQEQTTVGQEEKVMGGPVFGAITAIAAAAVVGAAAYGCKKVKDIVSKRCHGLQKAIVTAEDIGETMLFLTETSPVQNLSTIVDGFIAIAEDAVSTTGNGSESDAAV